MNNFIGKTNKDVYFYSPDGVISDKYKYSYLRNGQWVHLCDCNPLGTSSGADKENGFTNCKCAQSQYLDNQGVCKQNISTCYGNGNYFNGRKMVEGEFWNIKDPYCNFFNSSTDISSPLIEGRCCVGCSHKVYKGGVPEDKHNPSNPPDYALNWYSRETGTYDMTNLKYDTNDPILTPSGGSSGYPEKSDWRKYDYSIGYNSRPPLYYPKFDTSTPVNKAMVSRTDATFVNFDASKDGLGDKNCTGTSCSDVDEYRLMTSNIFTCKRTNPGEAASTTLSIPAFGVVGDELYYGDITNASATDALNAPFKDSKDDYVLEWYGSRTASKMWIPKSEEAHADRFVYTCNRAAQGGNLPCSVYAVGQVTPLKTTVLSDKKSQLSNQQVSDGVSDVVSDGKFTVGELSVGGLHVNDGWSRLYDNYHPATHTFTAKGITGGNAGTSCWTGKTYAEAGALCDAQGCHGMWKYNDNHGTHPGKVCLKRGTESKDINAYGNKEIIHGTTYMRTSQIAEKYKEVMVGSSPVGGENWAGAHWNVVSDPRKRDWGFETKPAHADWFGRKYWAMGGISTFTKGRTNEQLIDQCASLCSTERAVTGSFWNSSDEDRPTQECKGFWVQLEGLQRGNCWLKTDTTSTTPISNNFYAQGSYFELTDKKPAP